MITRRNFMAITAGATLASPWAVRTVNAAGGKLPALPDGAFTIAVIPDTQKYRGKGTKIEPKSTAPVTNAIFDTQTRFLADHLADQRIAFVSHVGDIVDRNVPEQWAVAKACMDTLHGKVPYGISVGNHDMKASGDASLFQQTFPATRFSGMKWYGGELDNNTCSFQLFEAGGLEFVWAHLPCNAPDAMLKWCDEVLAGHRNRLAAVTTHMYLGPIEKPRETAGYRTNPKGRMTWTKCFGKAGNSAVAMWDKCFSRHANLIAICCGDQSRSQAMHMSNTGVAGNVVHELLSDYGAGQLRLLRLIPDAGRIDVVTWNAVAGELCRGTEYVAAEAEHQYTLTARLARPAKRS